MASRGERTNGKASSGGCDGDRCHVLRAIDVLLALDFGRVCWD